MRPTAVLASALVRPALLLTTAADPQSVQSVPRLQTEFSAPGPPSSHQPSEAKLHVSVQACAVCSRRPLIRSLSVLPSLEGGGKYGGEGSGGGG